MLILAVDSSLIPKLSLTSGTLDLQNFWFLIQVKHAQGGAIYWRGEGRTCLLDGIPLPRLVRCRFAAPENSEENRTKVVVYVASR